VGPTITWDVADSVGLPVVVEVVWVAEDAIVTAEFDLNIPVQPVNSMATTNKDVAASL